VDTLTITANQIYGVYFHGPTYQVLERVGIEGSRAVGLMAASLPPNTQPADVASLMAPRLIELAFQTAGVWEVQTNGVLALPMALDRVTAYRQPTQAQGRRLYALVDALDGGKRFNAQVVDETGAVYVELLGYRTVQLTDGVHL
jgi:hypothetical protein